MWRPAASRFPRISSIPSIGMASLGPNPIEEAELTLEEASGVIADGYLRRDPEEWVRAVEKRRAALGR